MDWETSRHPLHSYRNWAAQPARHPAAAPEQARGEPGQPDIILSPAMPDDPRRLRAEHRQAERDEMLALVTLATQLAQAEAHQQRLVQHLPPALRQEYHRRCWEALHPDLTSWMNSQQLDAAYDQHRFTEWGPPQRRPPGHVEPEGTPRPFPRRRLPQPLQLRPPTPRRHRTRLLPRMGPPRRRRPRGLHSQPA